MSLEVLQFNLGCTFGSSGDLANDPRLFAGFTQHVQRGFNVFLRDADHHAYAAVQHAVHFGFVDVAFFLQPIEDCRALPAGHVDNRLGTFWQDARDVVQQAATGDVGPWL